MATYYPIYKAAYGPYGGITTPGTVAAPTNLRTTGATSSTIPLAWDAVAGSYTLQRAPVTNGTPGTFATVYTGTTKSYTDGALTFNTTYAYRVKVTVNGVDSPYSAVLQATTANNAPTTTPVALANHADSGGVERVGADGYKIRAMGASFSRRTTGAYLDVLVRASANYANANFTILVDGTKLATYYVPTNEASGKTYRIPLPNDGAQHVVKGILGDELRANEQGDVQGLEFVSVTDPAGATSTFITPVKGATVAVIEGDSISNEYGADSPGLTGWFSQAASAQRNVVRLGYGSAQLAVQTAVATRSTRAAYFAAAWSGVTDKVLVFQAGTNDRLSAQQVRDLLVAEIDYVNSLYPAARMAIITCLPRTDEASVGTAAIRQGQRQAAIDRGIYLVEAETAYNASTGTIDGVHPSQATYNTLTALATDAIVNATVPAGPPANFAKTASEARKMSVNPAATIASKNPDFEQPRDTYNAAVVSAWQVNAPANATDYTEVDLGDIYSGVVYATDCGLAYKSDYNTKPNAAREEIFFGVSLNATVFKPQVYGGDTGGQGPRNFAMGDRLKLRRYLDRVELYRYNAGVYTLDYTWSGANAPDNSKPLVYMNTPPNPYPNQPGANVTRTGGNLSASNL